MRIGQLARKNNIKQDEVILFLNKAQADLAPFHHNSKVSSDIVELVNNHFSLPPKEAEVATEEHSEDISVEAEEQILEVIEIKHDKKTEADLQQALDPTLPLIKTPTIDKKNEKSINTSRLLELLETDEASTELSKITHIKAPKKELSGLKVIGRIELPEPKSKIVKKSEDLDKSPKPVAYNRHEGQQLRKEEYDNRKLKEKKRKEQYEAREEKRRIEGEKKKKKAQNKARYQERMNAGKAKQKTQKEDIIPEVNEQPQTFKPLSLFDKFWKLFNL